MMQMKLKELDPGLFEFERTVTFETADGEAAAFVSVGMVDERKRTVSVDLLEEDESFALVNVISNTGTQTHKVPRSAIGEPDD